MWEDQILQSLPEKSTSINQSIFIACVRPHTNTVHAKQNQQLVLDLKNIKRKNNVKNE